MTCPSPIPLKSLKSGPTDPSEFWGQFDLELEVKPGQVVISFGDGSFLQIRPDFIYSEEKNGIRMKIIRGEAYFQSALKNWCGFLDLQIRLVPYGPPESSENYRNRKVKLFEVVKETPKEETIFSKFKSFFMNFNSSEEPKLIPSTHRYPVPGWWVKVPEFTHNGLVHVSPDRHRSLLEGRLWPIKDFDRIETLQLSRVVTIKEKKVPKENVPKKEVPKNEDSTPSEKLIDV